jgi:hypothetical protein
MNAKGLTIAVSVLVGIAALIVAVMAVGSVHLGPDKGQLTQAQYTARMTAVNQTEARVRALANDVPPPLPAVPARLSAAGAAEPGTSLPAASGPRSLPIPQPRSQPQVAPAGNNPSHDGDFEEGEGGGGGADD